MSQGYLKKLFQKSIRTLILVFWCLVSFAYDCEAQYNFSFQHLNQENGLNGGSTAIPFIDSRKFLWFGSGAELVRFDGTQTKMYPLGGNDSLSLTGMHIQNIAEDIYGDLWIQTETAINHYIRQSDSFIAILPESPDQGILVNPESVMNINSDGNPSIFSRHHTTLGYKIDRSTSRAIPLNAEELKRTKHFPEKYRVSYILDTPGLILEEKKDNGEIDSLFYFTGTEADYPLLVISQHYSQNDSIHWLLCQTGLYRFNCEDKSFRVAKDEHGTIYQGLGFFVPCENKIIINEAEKGLAIFDLSLEKIIARIPFSSANPQGLSTTNASPRFLSKEGDLILTNFAEGIDYTNIHKNKFDLVFDPSKASEIGASTFIRCIVESSNGNVLCVTHEDDILEFDKNHRLVYHKKFDQSNTTISGANNLIQDHSGLIWLASWGGLHTFDKKSGKTSVIHDPKGISENKYDRFHYVYQLKDGRILATGSFKSITQIDNTPQGPKLGEDLYVGNSWNEFFYLSENSDGRLYAFTRSTLNILEPFGNKFKEVKCINWPSEIKHVYETPDKSTLWLATISGITKMNLTDYSYETITSADGLPNSYCYSVVPDDFGNLWISTNRGICRFTPDKFDFANRSNPSNKNAFRNYTTADGLQGSEFNTYAFLKHSSGEFWFGGLKGINTFYPQNVVDFTVKPGIQITDLEINDKPDVSTIYIGERDSLIVDFENNTLSFRFVAIEYADPKSCKLKYMLSGYDKDWIQLANPGFARYPNLPPGDYVFQVMACNSDGIWSEEVRKLYILVKTPWYQTWWFKTLIVLIIAAILLGLYSFRIRQIKKLELTRNNIARDLHDDVGSTLGSISVYSEVAGMRAKMNQPIDDIVEKMGVASRDMIEKMSDIVWSVKSDYDDFENVIHRMKAFSAMILPPRNIEYVFEVDEKIKNLQVEMNVRRTLFLIFKETVYNSVKYSECKKMQIQLYYRAKTIQLRIEDDGKGFITDQISSLGGNGIKNMRDRAREVGGNYSIQSEIGKGTRTIVEIKL